MLVEGSGDSPEVDGGLPDSGGGLNGARRVLSLSVAAAAGDDSEESTATVRLLQLVDEIEQLALVASPGVWRSAVLRIQRAESGLPTDGEDSPVSYDIP